MNETMPKLLLKHFSDYREGEIFQRDIYQVVKKIGLKYSTIEDRSLMLKPIGSGIAEIQRRLTKSNISVSRTEIRNFISPSSKIKGIRKLFLSNKRLNYKYKIPYSSFEIYSIIIDMIHNDDELKKYCYENSLMIKDFNKCFCRDNLLNGLYTYLDDLPKLRPKQLDMYNKFRDSVSRKCNYKSIA